MAMRNGTNHDGGWSAIGFDPDEFERFFREQVDGVRSIVAGEVTEPAVIRDAVAEVFLTTVALARMGMLDDREVADWLPTLAATQAAAARDRAARPRVPDTATPDDQPPLGAEPLGGRKPLSVDDRRTLDQLRWVIARRSTQSWRANP